MSPEKEGEGVNKLKAVSEKALFEARVAVADERGDADGGRHAEVLKFGVE